MMMKKLCALLLSLLMLFSTVIAVSAEELDDTELADIASAEIATEAEPDYPAITSISAAANGLSLKWEAYPDAVSYRLYLWNTDANAWRKLADVSGTSYTHTGLKYGETYSFTVRAMDADGKFVSGFSNDGFSQTYFAVPTLSGISNEYTGQKVSWDAVPNAVNYRVFVKDGANWRSLGYSSGTSFLNTDVQSGVSYTYTVRIFTADGKTPLSYFNKRGLSGMYVSAPEISSASVLDGSVKLSWSAVPGAAKYRIFYKKGNDWIRVADTFATNHTINGFKNLDTYCYTLRALNRYGAYISAFDKTGFSVKYYATPKLTGASNEYSGQRISWTAVPSAAQYRVFIKDGAAWRSLGYTTGTSFLNPDVKSGVSYTYTVRVYSADGKTPLSYFSKQGLSAMYVAAPEISSATILNGSVKLSWSAVPGAAKYRLFYKNGKSWIRIADTFATEYTVKGLKNLDSYCYTLRALNRYGAYISAYDKAGFSVKYYSVPKLTAVSNEYGGQLVSWEAVKGAQNYRVYVREPKGEWKTIGSTSDASFLYTGAKSGVNHSYTVRVLSADGKKPLSYYDTKGVGGVFVAAPEIISCAPAENGTQVTWGEVSGASKYRLFYKSGKSWTRVGDTTDTKLTHTGLTDKTLYTYTVRAMDAKGNYLSAFNKTGTPHRYIAPPEFSVIKKLDVGMYLTWDPVVGAKGYRVYRKTLGGKWSTLTDTSDNAYIDYAAPQNTPYTYTLRCLDENGGLMSWFVSDSVYYYNGALADGKLTVGKSTVYFNKGKIRQGFVTIGGKQYYYNSNGVIQKNGIVGSDKEGYTVADANGVCCVTEEIRLAAEFMMKNCTGDTLTEKMKTGFMYLARNFPYSRTYDHPSTADDLPALAIDMFTNQRGNCFRYAACFTCIAKVAGYRARTVLGATGGNPHGWVEVLVDDKWLICDPDAQLAGYGTPAYGAYMMSYHFWSLSPTVRCELTIDGNGVATWK